MKKFILLVLLFLAATAMVSAQDKNEVQKKRHAVSVSAENVDLNQGSAVITGNNETKKVSADPDPFPEMISTGNPEHDKKVYAKAKADWIGRNPERYKEMQKSK